jgi:hydroxyacylglutathione hydrolase
LKFAQAVEPDNQLLAEYIKHCQALRNNQIPTLPSSIGVERDINPFLRSRKATVRQTVQNHTQQTITDDVQAFALLREWKNIYR